MSVWRIVSEPARVERRARRSTDVPAGEADREPTFGGPDDHLVTPQRAPAAPPDPSRVFDSFIDKITKWIPGDVLALYVAGVTVLSQPAGDPSLVFLIVMAVVTALVGILSAFAAGVPIGKATSTRIALAVAAFLIWSLTVPSSGWQDLEPVRQNPGLVAVAAGIFGLLFGLLAEGISRKLPEEA